MRRRITSSLSNHRMNRWENMLNVICRRLCPGATQLDDAMAVARRELLYALIHFDPAKARFVTYLYARVHGKVRHYLESERRHQRVELMDEGMLADLAAGESDDPAKSWTGSVRKNAPCSGVTWPKGSPCARWRGRSAARTSIFFPSATGRSRK